MAEWWKHLWRSLSDLFQKPQQSPDKQHPSLPSFPKSAASVWRAVSLGRHQPILVAPRRLLWLLKPSCCCKVQQPIRCWPGRCIHSPPQAFPLRGRVEDTTPSSPALHLLPKLITADMPWVCPGCGGTIQGLHEPQPSLHHVQALSSQQAAILPGQQLSSAGRTLHPLPQGVSHHDASSLLPVLLCGSGSWLDAGSGASSASQVLTWSSFCGQSPPAFTVRGWSLLHSPISTKPACSPLGTPGDWGSPSLWGLREAPSISWSPAGPSSTAPLLITCARVKKKEEGLEQCFNNT